LQCPYACPILSMKPSGTSIGRHLPRESMAAPHWSIQTPEPERSNIEIVSEESELRPPFVDLRTRESWSATACNKSWATRFMDTSSGQRRCWRLVSITCDLPSCRVQELWALDADDHRVWGDIPATVSVVVTTTSRRMVQTRRLRSSQVAAQC
jgi:hypothetical protein